MLQFHNNIFVRISKNYCYAYCLFCGALLNFNGLVIICPRGGAERLKPASGPRSRSRNALPWFEVTYKNINSWNKFYEQTTVNFRSRNLQVTFWFIISNIYYHRHSIYQKFSLFRKQTSIEPTRWLFQSLLYVWIQILAS